MPTQSTPETLNPPESETLALGFAVGDLVWGKIKNHHPPWWPGHVTVLDEADKSVVVSYFGTKITCQCDPKYLMPFAENYDRMSRPSYGNSKKRSFRAALNSALREMGKCLEAQLSCNCNCNCNSSLLPEEDRRDSRVSVSKCSNYSAIEFLGLARDAAVGGWLGGCLEVLKLRSWVVGFQRGVNVGHQRKPVSDLVEKIDLDDDPVIDTGEGEKEVDKSLIVGASRGRGRKKRSMAELIAETGLDSEEEEEKKELEVENDDGNVEGVKEEDEEVSNSSRRRERKKSKYLSPPYTYLSEQGLAKTLSSSKIPKALSSSKSFSVIEKCGSVEDMHKEEEKIQFDGIEPRVVLSEFLMTAVNPCHLKWNRLAKMVRGFFAEYRSSVFSSGSEFEAYQKKLSEYVPNNDVGIDSKEGEKSEENKETVKKDTDGEVETTMPKSEECKKRDGRKGRKKKIQVPNGVQETPVELVHLTIKHYDKTDNAAVKMMTTKEELNGNLPQAVTGSHEGKSAHKRRRRKSDSNHNDAVGLSSVTVNNADSGKEVGQTLTKEMEVASMETLTESGTKEEILGKNGKDGTVIDIPINLSGGNISNVSAGEGKKSRQRKKNKKTQDPTALHLTFTSGITLPSIEQLVTACSQYGPLIESETELLTESSSGQVVFKRASDAEKAFSNKVGALGQLVASYRLSYPNGAISGSPPPVHTPPTIEVPKPPLPYIRKSLERMISTLSGSPVAKVGAGASQGMKAEGMDNLVGEMHGLLSKVDKMLTAPAPGTSP